MHPIALLIGTSDGIGLAVARRLLSEDHTVIGISRSPAPLDHPAYTHHQCDVSSPGYRDLVARLAAEHEFDLCIYFTGIGEPIDITTMATEEQVVDVNLMGCIRTLAAVVPGMVARGRGHVVGLSSLADELMTPASPAYHASKAGMSYYLGSLALSLKQSGVKVTNLRFGFVDTKMAKGDVRPFMIPVEKAADHVMNCLRKQPRRYTAPWRAQVLVKLAKGVLRLRH